MGDQDEALAFYRDTRGLDVVTDTDMGWGTRRIEAMPHSAQRSIALSAAVAFDKVPARAPVWPSPLESSRRPWRNCAPAARRYWTLSASRGRRLRRPDATGGHQLQVHERPSR